MTTSKPRSPTPAQDICQQQQKIIANLRHENASLVQTVQQQEQRINVLETRDYEYTTISNLIVANPGMSFIHAKNNALLQQQNDIIARDREFRNQERAAERANAEAVRRTEIEKQVLADNPYLVKNCDIQKAKIQQIKDKMLDLATRFYDLTQEEARQYINTPRKPEELAVKHLLHEYLEEKEILGGKGKFTIYECQFCGDKSYNLDEFQRHCYFQREDHKPATLRDIEDEARANIAKANAELQRDIDNIIRSKENAEYHAGLERRRAYQARLKSSLPTAAEQQQSHPELEIEEDDQAQLDTTAKPPDKGQPSPYL